MGIWNIIAWIVIGGVAGWIAGKIARGSSAGVIMNIVIGIVGAAIGGFIMNSIGAAGTTGFNLWSLFVATLGAVVLLLVVGLIRKIAS